jgi:hypothetical protein
MTRQDEFNKLLTRHAALGRMLPDPPTVEEVRIRVDDLQLIISEMRKIEAQIDELLGAPEDQ